MPGETLEEALAAAADLGRQGMGTLLTQLGENVTDRAEAEAVRSHYLEALERIRERRLDAEVSVKLTQLGLDLESDLARDSLGAIAERARSLGGRVWIDMEGTAYTDATLDLYRRVQRDHPNVGVCLQAYLRRTAADVEALLPLGAAIRLVKGAYREPPELAFPRKPDVDESFFTLTCRLLGEEARRAGVWLAIGTHDARLIARIEAFAAAQRLEPAGFEFALLYGIQRGEQARLARAGTSVRVLISYGSHWFPWYMRRLAERPSNVLFALRGMLGR